MLTDERNASLLQVGELIRDLEQRSDDADTVLGDLTRNAARVVPGAQYAGITLMGRNGTVETVAPTHRYVVYLDDVQRRHLQGPCLSAGTENELVRIDDLSAELRWPDFVKDAVKLTPVRAVLSVPLFTARRHSAALNLYAAETGVFGEDSIELGLLFATQTALVWSLIRRSEQFKSALASRDIIGQAKGIVMERFGLDAVDAFELIKKLSQDSNTPVAEIARRMVHANHPRQ
jgi:GAF domain-containing protein